MKRNLGVHDLNAYDYKKPFLKWPGVSIHAAISPVTRDPTRNPDVSAGDSVSEFDGEMPSNSHSQVAEKPTQPASKWLANCQPVTLATQRRNPGRSPCCAASAGMVPTANGR